MATKVTVGPGDQDRLVEQESSVTITDDTLVDIPGMAFEMRAGVTYQFKFSIYADASGVTDDADFGVSGPTALTGDITWTRNTSLGDAQVGETLDAAAISRTTSKHDLTSSRPQIMYLSGKVSNAVNATFQVQAAQDADGTQTLEIRNSWGNVRICSIPAVVSTL